MDDEAGRPGPEGPGESGDGEPLGRRRFLGAVAAGAAVAAAGAVAGCDAGEHSRSAAPSAAQERGRPGDADWRIRSTGPADAVQGYTDKVSVLPGEDFTLHVSTTAPGFRVSAYRVGWYGGAQARRVWRSGRVPGRVQGRARLVPATRTIRADWEPTLRVRTDDWPEGAYLLRLDAENGHQRYVPLIVRSVSGIGKTVLMHAPATWQAYNLWGGYSLYEGQGGAYAYRSMAVSFDRPYDRSGAEKFLVYERAVVVLAERLGIPLAYTTGPDVHLAPAVLRGATAAVALGHDEYWTPEQRRHVTAARDAGTNLAFLGANTCYRRVRLERGPSGPVRTVVCYKTDYAADPYLAKHPSMATTDFRSHPAADPESALTGVIYEGFPTDAPYVVERPGHWLFAGTGVGRGESFDHLVGVEYDRVVPHFTAPSPLEIVAHSPLVCHGRASHADSAYYTVPSGAGVFASGTMRWVEALMAGTGDDGRDHGMDARAREFVTRTTENLLRAFAEGPAGGKRPAPRDNVRSVYRV
ncbi:N,N-dimethylformamidase beta subunit family domain-containing protein [Streptomyces polygonati]|uniref:N,N-dimethylformamidase beta subunit family domain-containing protein n=1 Tax=Streptomyces polygonati TaxID=1617087 RepID=A0ABV8HJD8_9ACTN